MKVKPSTSRVYLDLCPVVDMYFYFILFYFYYFIKWSSPGKKQVSFFPIALTPFFRADLNLLFWQLELITVRVILGQNILRES